MSANNSLRAELSKHLSNKQIDEFENGDLCLYLEEPTHTLVRVSGSGFEQAEVTIDEGGNSRRNFQMYGDVEQVTSQDILQRAKKQTNVEANPIGLFEDLT